MKPRKHNVHTGTQQRANDYRLAAGRCSAVAEVIREYDKKMLTLRFAGAVERATDYKVYVKTPYGRTLLFYTFPKHGHAFEIALAEIPLSEMESGNRIPADKLLSSLEEHRDLQLRKAEEIATIHEEQVF